MTKGPKKQGKVRILLARFMLWALLAWLAISVLPVLALRWLPPPTSAFMLQYWMGGEAGTGGFPDAPRYHWTPWNSIAPAMRLAVVAAEDQKFPTHHGFDFASMHDAVRDYIRGDDLRGASTISQQVAKNLFLWPGKTFWRKGLEAWFTLLIELCWPKQRILEVYLNIAEFGPGIYGVEAAGLTFFHKTAAMLEPREAALLASVLPNPRIHDVGSPSAYMLERRRWILRQMQQLGGPAYITDMPR